MKVTNYGSLCYHTVTVTGNKMCPVTVMITGVISAL